MYIYCRAQKILFVVSGHRVWLINIPVLYNLKQHDSSPDSVLTFVFEENKIFLYFNRETSDKGLPPIQKLSHNTCISF